MGLLISHEKYKIHAYEAPAMYSYTKVIDVHSPNLPYIPR